MSLRHVATRSTPADCRAQSRLEIWEAAGKPFFVLAQKGRFADICYDHGRLLAKEVEDGVFPEILATIAHDVDASRSKETGKVDEILGAFFNRLSRDVLKSTSDEFRRGVEALADGCFAELTNPLFNDTAVEHACVAIDTGNVATGFEHLQSASPLSVRTGHWRRYAVRAWATHGWGRVYGETGESTAEDDEDLADWLDNMRRVRRGRRAGMGCTGFWAAPGLTSDGLGLHARNFDGAFFSWNNHPILHLIDETDQNASWHRYAAIGTAGLVYPGGISGMNDAGLAVSLHQMSTVNFSVGDGSGDFDVAPYVQQRMLREASTLDEAVDIARERKHFASWTILVSHAPSGKALRIELNGADDVESGKHVNRVEPSDKADRLVQTNHFLSDALRERHNTLEDAHFTHSVGKWMESRARFKTAEERLDEHIANGDFGTAEAHDLQASHVDGALDGAPRSFGRTICKAYSLMSSIARASADRAHPADEIWFTIGERLPGPHATLAGFHIDWAGLKATAAGTHVAATVDAGQLAALEAYVEAFSICDRPRDASGAYYRRKPTATEMQAVRKKALAAMDRAVTAADGAGLDDPVFRYVRARLAHETALAMADPDRPALLSQASGDWAWLREKAGAGGVAMTTWERALIHILSAATEAARGADDATVDGLLQKGSAHLEDAAQELYGSGPVHRDIKVWRKAAAAIDADGGMADLPSIDFVTVE
jgi:hypothetical protein